MITPANVYIIKDKIYLSLPFSMTGLDATEKFSTSDIPRRLFAHGKNSNTDLTWDVEHKAWAFSLAEVNFTFIQDFLQSLEITRVEYSDEARAYLDTINEIKQSEDDYKVELCVDNELKPYIKNAHHTLLDYLEKEGITDLWDLIDKSGELGYSLSNKVKLMLNDSVEHIMASNTRVSLVGTVKEKEKKLKHMILYALKYNRLPIVFYSPERLGFGPRVDTGIAKQDSGVRLVTKQEKMIDPQFDPMVFKVVRQFIKDNAVGKAERVCKKDCLVYYAHNVQDLIESEVNPQLIFFTRMINEKTFNIYLDQIPKVCYYNTINSPLSDEDKKILQQLGPGQAYYAKV